MDDVRREHDKISRGARETFQELDELVKPEKGHAALRKAMRDAARGPAVPYLGLYLTDLTFIEDGNPDFINEGGQQMVNLGKCHMVGKALTEVRQFQKKSYGLPEHMPTSLFFSALSPPPDDAIFSASLVAEPRKPASPGESDASKRPKTPKLNTSAFRGAPLPSVSHGRRHTVAGARVRANLTVQCRTAHPTGCGAAATP